VNLSAPVLLRSLASHPKMQQSPFEDECPYLDMTQWRMGGCDLEDDDYPPYWPPGTPPVIPSWVFPVKKQVNVKIHHMEAKAKMGFRHIGKYWSSAFGYCFFETLWFIYLFSLAKITCLFHLN